MRQRSLYRRAGVKQDPGHHHRRLLIIVFVGVRVKQVAPFPHRIHIIHVMALLVTFSVVCVNSSV